MRNLALVLCAAVAAFAAALSQAPARAHDSLAPPSARYQHPWLPHHEPWVHEHWLPYDEARLNEILRVDTPTVFRWLKNDHRTLAQLARRRGVDPRGLAGRLLAERRTEVSRAAYRRLLERTRRMLTQGHLAQHVLFHVFHGPELVGSYRRFLGVSERRYRVLRYKRGVAPATVARRNARDPDTLEAHARRRLRRLAADGFARHATSQRQADAMLARQERVLRCWIHRPAPKFDPDHPFGDPLGGHGPHRRGSRVGIKHPKPARGCWRGLFRG